MCSTCSALSENSRSFDDKAGIARKSYFSFKSTFIAGAIATAAMTIFTFMAPLMGFSQRDGFPEMNIPKMLASAMSAPIIVGWTAHFMIGEILAVSFAAVFLKRTNRSANPTSGALFSLIPWLIAQVMVMPVMSIINGGSYAAGLFSASIIIAMASLIGHLIYGAVLGSIYKPKIATAITTV